MNCRRFAYILLTIVGFFGMASCADTKEPPVVPPDEILVNLSFSVVAPPSADSPRSRANVVISPDKDNYFEREASRYERINTLRIIIVRPDGTVEHNKLFNFSDDGVVYCDDMTFKVTGGEKKKIYILGNEACVPFDFSSIEGTYVPGTIENITISAGPDSNVLFDNSEDSSVSHYLPMCEVHEVYVSVPRTIEEFNQTVGSLFITRAAVKFSFNFSADNGEGFYVRDVTINSLAAKEYYLPNSTVYNPVKTAPSILNWTGAAEPKIESRFIVDYKVPENVAHTPQTFTIEGGLAFGTTDNPATLVPALYFCESAYNPTSTEPYSLTMTISGKDKDSEGNAIFVDTHTFGPVELPNLPFLPRNTHVVINIHLTGTDIECTVKLVPYTGIWLDPDFGIDRD